MQKSGRNTPAGFHFLTDTPILSSAFYFTRTQAARANVHGSVSTLNNRLNTTNIGFPSSVGFAVRVRYVVTKHNAFTADTAFCHTDTSCKYLYLDYVIVPT